MKPEEVEVTESVSVKPVKVVTIRIGEGTQNREYNFYGSWQGKDVRQAISGLFRAYRLHKRDELRKLAGQSKESELSHE